MTFVQVAMEKFTKISMATSTQIYSRRLLGVKNCASLIRCRGIWLPYLRYGYSRRLLALKNPKPNYIWSLAVKWVEMAMKWVEVAMKWVEVSDALENSFSRVYRSFPYDIKTFI